jgi:hypothetical protein
VKDGYAATPDLHIFLIYTIHWLEILNHRLTRGRQVYSDSVVKKAIHTLCDLDLE